MGHRDDAQCQMGSAEVMTAALVAALYFGDNFALACRMLHEQGYMPRMLSASRFNRRLHRIKPLFTTLFAYLGETFKQLNEASVYVMTPFRCLLVTTIASAVHVATAAKTTGATKPASDATSTG